MTIIVAPIRCPRSRDHMMAVSEYAEAIMNRAIRMRFLTIAMITENDGNFIACRNPEHRGVTYQEIASKFNTTLDSLKKLNDIEDITSFPQYGQILQVAVNLVTPTPTPVPTYTEVPAEG